MNFIWNKENCLDSAKKYRTKLDWHKGQQSAYQAARRNGWFNECIKHMDVIIIAWTKAECIKNARKYNNISDWIKNEKRAYGAAYRYGWITECRAHMPNKLESNKKTCLESARTYSSITEWITNDKRGYHMAWKHKWLQECTVHMVKKGNNPKGYWTKARCIESAQKFNKISDWVASDGGKAYGSACRNKWRRECTAHMQKNIKLKYINTVDLLTKADCLISARKHKRIYTWIKTDKIAYRTAKHFEWLEECTAPMAKVEHWNKIKCLRTAQKFNRIIDWQKAHGSAYVTARLKGWLVECTAHMQKSSKTL